ncbi:MAG: CoA transferase [Desulfobacterium sp.]|nr:CoA transferase [Desulfobacteraceae bacterium]MBA3035667.1 CoA transferase [Desulfobacterium sp.]
MPETKKQPQPLDGIKVIEIGNKISTAYCSKMLADQGAEVVKVEDPRTGKQDRQERILSGEGKPGSLFAYVNCNKFGIKLDVEQQASAKIIEDLVRQADILVEGYTPQTAKDMGIDYHRLRQINPNLIVLSITPFGQTGPYCEYNAYAINISAAAASSLCIGEPGRTPLPLPLSQVHFQSAAMGATAALGAIFAREFTGRGQHIDISESEVWMTHFTGHAVIAFVFHNRRRIRSGHKTQALYPNGIFHCKDGYITLLAMRGEQWKAFLNILGEGKIPEWYSSDERFMKTTFRELNLKYGDELEVMMEKWLTTKTKEEIFQLGRKNHVALAPVKDVREVLEDAHLAYRKYFVEVEDPEVGKVKYPPSALRFSKTPSVIHRPAPKLGEHNEEIYGGWLGYGKTKIEELKSNGVI